MNGKVSTTSDRKNWKIKDEPSRNKDDYEVIVAPSEPVQLFK